MPGTEGETAQCTEDRERGKRLGLDVTVGPRLRQLGRAAIYECALPERADLTDLSVPASGLLEVSEIEWINPMKKKSRDARIFRYIPAACSAVEP